MIPGELLPAQHWYYAEIPFVIVAKPLSNGEINLDIKRHVLEAIKRIRDVNASDVARCPLWIDAD